jgi:hypothetical protein
MVDQISTMLIIDSIGKRWVDLVALLEMLFNN